MNTNRPHPRSYPRFHGRSIEIVNCAANDPDALIASGIVAPEGVAAVVQYFRTCWNVDLDLRRAARISALREDGVSEDALAHPAFAAVVDENIALRWRPDARPMLQDEDGNWKPHRETMTELHLAAYLEAVGSEAKAADLLNTLGPTGRRLDVTKWNVRNGVRRFTKDTAFRYLRPLDARHPVPDFHPCVALGVMVVLPMRMTLALWREYHAAKGRTPIDAYLDAMISNGRFFHDWQRIGASRGGAKEEPRRNGQVILRLWLDYIQALAVKKFPSEFPAEQAGRSARPSAAG
ncbi:hypothetical protein [Xanthobacter autotrophicus]|uniref:hypothetical protein n=1 Tax=Xanthobacter autotrophicus TaxID=280 RepID=UPI00372BCDB6